MIDSNAESTLPLTLSPASTESPARPARRSLEEIIRSEGRRRHRRQAAWWGALGALPLIAAGLWLGLRPRPLSEAARFRAQPMTLGDVVREVQATGRLEAVTTVAVGAEISGRIASVEVDYNARVKAGQVLARFDRAALEAQVAQARATRAAAKAALAQAKIERAQAERNRERARQLRANQLLAEADEETAISNAWLAAQRAEAAESQVLAQDAAFDLVRTNREHALIRSPIDGIIITRNVDPGQTVASALATPVLFSVAANLEKMQVVAAVDEADIGQVARGQNVTFGVNAYPDRVFEGELTEVRNSPVIVQDVVTYGCVVSVDNSDLSLKPGMTASVRIRTAQVSGVARVPSAALHFSMPNEAPADGQSVWILDAGPSRRVPVRPGISDGELTEVSAGALAEGAQVIVDLTPQGRKAYGIQQ